MHLKLLNLISSGQGTLLLEQMVNEAKTILSGDRVQFDDEPIIYHEVSSYAFLFLCTGYVCYLPKAGPSTNTIPANTIIALVLRWFGPFLKATVIVSFACFRSKNVLKNPFPCNNNNHLKSLFSGNKSFGSNSSSTY